MSKVGRKSKLTPEVQNTICKGLEAGMSQESAAIYAGISESTYYLWLEKGEKATRGKFLEFLEAVNKSKATILGRLEVEAHRLSLPHTVVTKREVLRKDGTVVELKTTTTEVDSQMTRFILERRHPDLWGKKEKIDITSGDKPLDISLFGVKEDRQPGEGGLLG